MPPVVLFDIDGTLLTTHGATARAWRLATRHLHGFDVDIQSLTENGMTDRLISRVVLSNVVAPDKLDDARDALLARRDKELETLIAEADVTVMPGVKERLAQLRDDGALLGLVTGNTPAAARLKLERIGIADEFRFGGYGDSSEKRVDVLLDALSQADEVVGDQVDAEEVVTVGDTPRDVEAAREAGTRSVGVATGRFDRETLQLAGADAVIENLLEPVPFVGG